MPRKNNDIEKQLEIEKAIAADFAENDDIVDYVEGKALDKLRKRYETADEDEEIRSEGFEPIQKPGLFRKRRPGGYGYYYSPQALNNPDEIKSTGKSPLAQLFDTAKSEYDSDSISFRDIDIDAPAPGDVLNEIPLQTLKDEHPAPLDHQSAEELSVKPPEEPPKRKRGRPKKIKPEELVASAQSEKEKEPEQQSSMSKIYNTNTKVIFSDETADDGIQRNSDREVSSAFSDDESNYKRRRGLFSLFRKH